MLKSIEQMKKSFGQMFGSIKTSSMEIHFCGTLAIICTLAPNFKKGTKEWKLSGIIDFESKISIFCQSEIFAMDNWTLFEALSLGDLLEQVFPGFKDKLISHLPADKAHLGDDLYKVTFTCGEIVFAIKEIIALTQIFTLPEDKIIFVLDRIKNKDGAFPYLTSETRSYKDGIALYIETLVSFINSSPIPIKLKMNGRGATAYGFLSFASAETKKLLEDNGIVFQNLEDVLKSLLVALKVMVVSNNPVLQKLWKWLADNKFSKGEFSGDDKFWAKYYLSVPKDDLVEVSVLGDILIKICGLEMTALNGWKEAPFSSCMDIISDTFKNKGIISYLEESSHVKKGADYLGIVCQSAEMQMFH
jgi:hypothetical protein